MWTAWAAAGVPIVAVAFALRIAVHAGRQPGGVDTWYYLAYADAFRRRPGFEVRLPQYLLQDEVQSYPPMFPMLLAALPRAFLRRWFWTVSPAIDCVHLLLLYWLAFKITGSLPVAAVTASVYALTPQLVAETRSLMGRSFAALLHSIAVLLALRFVMFDQPWPWLPLALVAGAALFLTSATAAAGYAVVALVLSAVRQDVRFAAIAAGALALAVVGSGGHFLRVVANWAHAVAYWRRNRRLFGAHPIRHSPVYGGATTEPPRARPGFLGANVGQEVLRLLGENPYVLALPLAPAGVPPWGVALYWWAVSLAALAIIATVLPPLRAFGPGRSFLKTAVFPTAYTLAVGIGTRQGLLRPVGVATLLGLAVSVAAIAFFYVYTRQASERTASVPEGLADAVRHLGGLPGDGVLCLPYMYADYVCYNSGKSVLWGGHCGDLRRLEALAPVICQPFPDLFARYGVRYVLLDSGYASAGEIGISGVDLLGRWDGFELYDVVSKVGPAGT
jgi:hypothetical protein